MARTKQSLKRSNPDGDDSGDRLPCKRVRTDVVKPPVAAHLPSLTQPWRFLCVDMDKDLSTIEWHPQSAKDPVATAKAFIEAFVKNQRNPDAFYFENVMEWATTDRKDAKQPEEFANIRRDDLGIFTHLMGEGDMFEGFYIKYTINDVELMYLQ